MKLNKRTVLSFFLIAMFLGTTLISLSDMLCGGNKNMGTIVKPNKLYDFPLIILAGLKEISIHSSFQIFFLLIFSSLIS